MTTDPIAAARAMIEPLTGYTPRPWHQGRNNPDRVSRSGEYIANCNPTHQSRPRNESNARLIAAAPDLRDMVATLADALEAERAKGAAAYEAGQLRMRELCGDMVEREGHGLHVAIRYAPLTPADAQAALDKMLAAARLEGWRAGRDAAAEICDGTAKYHMSDPDDIEVVRLTAAEIRSLPEPKEAGE